MALCSFFPSSTTVSTNFLLRRRGLKSMIAPSIVSCLLSPSSSKFSRPGCIMIPSARHFGSSFRLMFRRHFPRGRPDLLSSERYVRFFPRLDPHIPLFPWSSRSPCTPLIADSFEPLRLSSPQFRSFPRLMISEATLKQSVFFSSPHAT